MVEKKDCGKKCCKTEEGALVYDLGCEGCGCEYPNCSCDGECEMKKKNCNCPKQNRDAEGRTTCGKTCGKVCNNCNCPKKNCENCCKGDRECGNCNCGGSKGSTVKFVLIPLVVSAVVAGVTTMCWNNNCRQK